MTKVVSAQPAQPARRGKFQRDEKGGVAITFGLALVPMLLFMGAAIDYSRANAEHTRLQSAVDAAVLALAHEPKNTPLATMQTKGQKLFAANFLPEGGGAVPSININVTAKTISGNARSDLPTSFIRLGGQNAITVGASSVASYGTKNIELALVLDNTGSMAQNGKIQALRASVSGLIDKLKATSQVPGDVKVSLVPFTTQVKVTTALKNAAWLRWDVTLENTGLSLLERAPPTPAAWTGCLSDRDQTYDAQSVPANGLQSKYPASKCQNDGLLPMAFLTTDLEAIRTESNLMQPLNNTNVTVGFVNGMSTLRSDHPFGTGAVDNADTVKFLVLLTDGDNTANRYGGNPYSALLGAPVIDSRLAAACAQAKSDAKVKVFTIRVMDGNAALLKSCATTPEMYYDVQNAAQMQGVFDDIARAITNIHLQS